jgi:hypothetical protein
VVTGVVRFAVERALTPELTKSVMLAFTEANVAAEFAAIEFKFNDLTGVELTESTFEVTARFGDESDCINCSMRVAIRST